MYIGPDFPGAVFLDRNIRHLRRNLGWSQEELGQRIGLNRGNIASYENGTAEPKICNLLKIADLFGVSILDITYKDLSMDVCTSIPLESALPQTEHSTIKRYMHQAQEIQSVMKGLQTCCHFKLKQAGEVSPNDLYVVAMHFEELFNVAEALLKDHLELLHQLENPGTSGE